MEKNPQRWVHTFFFQKVLVQKKDKHMQLKSKLILIFLFSMLVTFIQSQPPTLFLFFFFFFGGRRKISIQYCPQISICESVGTYIYLYISGPSRTRPTADAGPLLRGIQALRPDNQSRKDGGTSPTCTSSPTITIDDKPFANVEHFKYLRSIISCDGSLDREIDTRISKASQALGSLRNQVLSEHNICLSTKLKVYNAVVLPSLPPLWLWDVDTVSQTYQETGALLHPSSPLHPGNQVAGPHHQSGGPRSS